MAGTSLLLARAAILPLVPVQLGIAAWYVLYWDFFPKYSVRRLLALLMLMLSPLGIIYVQAFIYRSITSIEKIDDLYVAVTIFLQSVLAISLMLYLALKRDSPRINESYRQARRKLLKAVGLYGIVILGPLFGSLAFGIYWYGPRAKPSPYIMVPVFIWGYFWLCMMLNYVRSHPLPPPN